jgi:hypothetical protein
MPERARRRTVSTTMPRTARIPTTGSSSPAVRLHWVLALDHHIGDVRGLGDSRLGSSRATMERSQSRLSPHAPVAKDLRPIASSPIRRPLIGMTEHLPGASLETEPRNFRPNLCLDLDT